MTLSSTRSLCCTQKYFIPKTAYWGGTTVLVYLTRDYYDQDIKVGFDEFRPTFPGFFNFYMSY